VLAEAKDPESRTELARILRNLDNRVKETASTAQIGGGYGEDGYRMLHSAGREDAVVLEALLVAAPEHELIPKLARGLLAHRRQGRWGNTQENVFSLLALDRYFHVFERETPNFQVRAWLGEGFVGDHRFKGRSTERHHMDIPLGYLTEHKGAVPLLLEKKGPGRLYYRLGLRYTPRSLDLPAESHGFAVERRYEAVEDPGDVRLERDGTVVIKAAPRCGCG
jgi:alpha-2-macroglobulin